MKSILFMTIFASLSSHAYPPQAAMDQISRIDPTVYGVAQSEIPRTLGVLDPCRQTDVKLSVREPIQNSPATVDLDIYSLKLGDSEARKTVILMPPTGGENALDRGYAYELCVSGFRVALVQHWQDDTLAELDLGMHDRGALRMLAAVKQTIGYLNPKRTAQIGILGTSVGAISSVLAMHQDARIQSGVLIVGGIGMSEIIGQSTEATLTRLRTERSQHFNFSSTEQYVGALAAQIKIEPGDFIGSTGSKATLMFIATQDVTVPTENQTRLLEALKLRSGFNQPEVVYLNRDHFGGILETSLTLEYRRRIVNFFSKTLD